MDDKARKPKPSFNVIILTMMLLLFPLAIGVRFLPEPSPDRCPGARAEDQVPSYLADARYAHAAGPPPPVAVRHPAPGASVLPPPHPDRKLLDAIRAKEGWDSLMEPNVGGERGPYQIKEAFWTDALEWGQKGGIDPESPEWNYYTNVYDPDKCEFIIWLYWQRYLDPDADDYSKALAHNGGPPDGQKLEAHSYAREIVNMVLAMRGD